MKSKKEIRKWLNDWLWESTSKEYQYMPWTPNRIEEIIRMLIDFQKETDRN